MKYEVTYKCGHTGTVTLYGNSEARERAIYGYEYYKVCPECYEAEKEAEKVARIEKYDLPELDGTDKQVKWASDIRHKFIKEIEELVNGKEVPEPARTFFDELMREPSASEWIKRANTPLSVMFRRWAMGR